jgi:maltose O-acetyltransferase
MTDPELIQYRKICRLNLKEFNQANSSYIDKNDYLTKLSKLLPYADQSVIIEQPFYCDYGFNIIIKENVFINYDCKLLDACSIYIGENTLIGPNVNIYASSHPLDKDLRLKHIGLARPIVIGSDCWIGGNSTILPGVTIGNNVIVGAGSVVTKNIPNDVTIAGNPAKVIKRSINPLNL